MLSDEFLSLLVVRLFLRRAGAMFPSYLKEHLPARRWISQWGANKLLMSLSLGTQQVQTTWPAVMRAAAKGTVGFTCKTYTRGKNSKWVLCFTGRIVWMGRLSLLTNSVLLFCLQFPALSSKVAVSTVWAVTIHLWYTWLFYWIPLEDGRQSVGHKCCANQPSTLDCRGSACSERCVSAAGLAIYREG